MEELLAICGPIAQDLKCTIPNLIVKKCILGLQGMYCASIRTITINAELLKDLRYKEFLIKTIAHEMRHHWQYESGMLKQQDNYLVWKGEDFAIIFGTIWNMEGRNINYHEYPWEIDANQYSEQYLERQSKAA